MYHNHFCLTCRPFEDAPNTRFCFPSLDFQNTLAGVTGLLAGSATQETPGVIAVVVADAGLGKTLLARKLAEGVHPHTRGRVCMSNPSPDREAFMRALCAAFGERSGDDATTAEMVGRLGDAVARGQSVDSPSAVIVDDAHRLDARVLNLLALLVELRLGGRPLIRVVLLGDRRLDEQLAATSASSCRNRVRAVYRLGPMCRPETLAYIDHRLAAAGHAGRPIFDPATAAAVHHRSGGVPRLVNRLCDAIMLSTFARRRRRVSIADVPVDEHAADEHVGVEHVGVEHAAVEAGYADAPVPAANLVAAPAGMRAVPFARDVRDTRDVRNNLDARRSTRPIPSVALQNELERRLIVSAERLSRRLRGAVEQVFVRAAINHEVASSDRGWTEPAGDIPAARPGATRSTVRRFVADFGQCLEPLRRLGSGQASAFHLGVGW